MTSNFLELLPLAKKLNEANKVLLEKEAVLRQLSLLQNASHSFENFSKLFQVDCRFLPCIYSETLLVSVRNVSEMFNFDPHFWSIMICFPNGKVTHWKFESTFRFGDCEQFSAEFQPAFDSETIELTIKLIFSIKWHELIYTKTFLVQSISADMLYFLSAGRRVAPSVHSCTVFPKTPASRNYPLCCKFSIFTDTNLRSVFLEHVFLKNVDQTRGFDLTSVVKTFESSGEFVAYYYEDKITVTIEEDKFLCFRCPNANVLGSIKIACYNRLHTLCKSALVRIRCAQKTSELAQKFYGMSLNLRVFPSDSDVDLSQLIGYYYNLREYSESLLFFCA